jgi:hypothetical protein
MRLLIKIIAGAALALGGYGLYKFMAKPSTKGSLSVAGETGTYTVRGDRWEIVFVGGQWNALPSPTNKKWTALLGPITKNTPEELAIAIDGLYT